MGARKTEFANKLKQAREHKAFAVLRNCPSSPRKMRYVVDLIRGVEVNKALDILKYSNKEAAGSVEKLLLSALANWQVKNEGLRVEDSNLIVKEAFVDCGTMAKRLRTAPQGRAYRVRKRSNHVTLVLDSATINATQTK
jgi:large subunit ribosomal protein L22